MGMPPLPPQKGGGLASLAVKAAARLACHLAKRLRVNGNGRKGKDTGKDDPVNHGKLLTGKGEKDAANGQASKKSGDEGGAEQGTHLAVVVRIGCNDIATHS